MPVGNKVLETLAFIWIAAAMLAYLAQFRDLVGPIAALLGM